MVHRGTLDTTTFFLTGPRRICLSSKNQIAMMKVSTGLKVDRGAALQRTHLHLPTASSHNAHLSQRTCRADLTPSASPAVDRREAIVTLIGASVSLAAAPRPAAADVCPTLITSASGLQFCDVVEGKGDPAVPKARIKAHYAGRLSNSKNEGTFDSSYDRGRPLTFQIGVGQVRSKNFYYHYHRSRFLP
jgi:hypothetical protein